MGRALQSCESLIHLQLQYSQDWFPPHSMHSQNEAPPNHSGEQPQQTIPDLSELQELHADHGIIYYEGLTTTI